MHRTSAKAYYDLLISYSLAYETKTYVVTAFLPTVKGLDTVNYSTRSLPPVRNIEYGTSAIDVNEELMSFHAIDEDYIYVLDWTHTDSCHEESIKGVIMCTSVHSVRL